MSERTISQIQEDIAARLEADEYFSDIGVLTERKQDIASKVEMALGALEAKAGKSGVCVICMQPLASVTNLNTMPALWDIKLTVRVLENVLVNTSAGGTGKEALSVAWRIARVLTMYYSGYGSSLIPESPTIVPVDDLTGALAYEVRFRCEDVGGDAVSRVDMPDIAVTGSAYPLTVTLACATAGADIYYTLDETYPSAVNAQAMKYTAAFAVQAACTIRAAAHKSGCISSNTTLRQID